MPPLRQLLLPLLLTSSLMPVAAAKMMGKPLMSRTEHVFVATRSDDVIAGTDGDQPARESL